MGICAGAEIILSGSTSLYLETLTTLEAVKSKHKNVAVDLHRKNSVRTC